ncbi:MAG: DUF4432 family protein [Actinomycetota bacterium]
MTGDEVPAGSPGRYLEAGEAANLDQFASAALSTVVGGPAHGCRALDLRVAEGIDVRILPDRGFDVGPAWFRGVPLAWISAVGETAPIDEPSGTEWLAAFGGGLVTTCGLRNVGAPSEGHGLHGRYSHLRAGDVRVDRHLENGEVLLTARATLDEAEALGPHLRVERAIRTRTGTGLLEVTDVTTNLGSEPEPAPILYHVNLGVPLWSEGGRLHVDTEEVRPRDADAERGLGVWMEPAPADVGAPELVFEHRVRPGPDGWAEARVTSPPVGLALALRWDHGTLPRFHQWVLPRRGIYALGLEPANCSVLGRAADREAGTLPMLGPGERRTTRIRIEVTEAREG